jgi:hypothetical protein
MVQCNYLVEEFFSPEVLLEQGIGKMASQTHKANASLATSPSCRTLAVIVPNDTTETT